MKTVLLDYGATMFGIFGAMIITCMVVGFTLAIITGVFTFLASMFKGYKRYKEKVNKPNSNDIPF